MASQPSSPEIDDPLDTVADALAEMKRIALGSFEEERVTGVTSTPPDPEVTITGGEFVPGPILRLGATGPHVAKLQVALNRRGANPALIVTGEFDHATIMAVRWAQSVHGLTPNGEVDHETWRALLTGHAKQEI
jgi:peptidoglycan hydrolase-like protein with peptidoglycan-binding domain